MGELTVPGLIQALPVLVLAALLVTPHVEGLKLTVSEILVICALVAPVWLAVMPYVPL